MKAATDKRQGLPKYSTLILCLRAELKRTASQAGKKFSDDPFILDKRGRKIYRWDTFFSDCADPLDLRKRDVWDLAERLDEQPKRGRHTQAQIAKKEKERQALLDKIAVLPEDS